MDHSQNSQYIQTKKSEGLTHILSCKKTIFVYLHIFLFVCFIWYLGVHTENEPE